MTADQIKVVEFNKGDRFRIVDPDHKYAGRTGTLEFHVSGACWLRVGSTDVQVSLKQLKHMPPLTVVA